MPKQSSLINNIYSPSQFSFYSTFYNIFMLSYHNILFIKDYLLFKQVTSEVKRQWILSQHLIIDLGKLLNHRQKKPKIYIFTYLYNLQNNKNKKIPPMYIYIFFNSCASLSLFHVSDKSTKISNQFNIERKSSVAGT